MLPKAAFRLLMVIILSNATLFNGTSKAVSPNTSAILDMFVKKNPLYNRFKNRLIDVAERPEEYSELLLQLPEYAVNGGINYAMTFDQMKETIKKKFQALKAAGNIVSPAEFEQIKSNYFVDERRGFQDYAQRDLKRIWGADYINNYQHYITNFKQPFIQPWRAPDYIIVVNNPNLISISLDVDPDITKLGARARDYPSQFDRSPDADRPYIDTIVGTVYFKKIEGDKIATTYHDYEEWLKSDATERFSPELQKYNLGYKDFSSDPGNIIRSTDGQAYIVDTELDSFDLIRTFKGRKMTLEKLLAIEGLLKAIFMQTNKNLPISKDGTLNMTINLTE